MKGKGGRRPKHHNFDGDVPLCLRKIDEESKDGISSNKKKEEDGSESITLNSMKEGSKSKMTS